MANIVQYLNVRDVCARTKLSKTKICELINKGDLPYIKIDSSTRFDEADIIDWQNGLKSKSNLIAAWPNIANAKERG